MEALALKKLPQSCDRSLIGLKCHNMLIKQHTTDVSFNTKLSNKRKRVKKSKKSTQL